MFCTYGCHTRCSSRLPLGPRRTPPLDLDDHGHRTVVHELKRHPRTEASTLGAEFLAHPFIERLGLLPGGGVHETRAVALACVAVDGEVADAQDLALRVREREVHAVVVVLEHS